MEKRVFLIVLDSFGIGAEPDAAAFAPGGDQPILLAHEMHNFNQMVLRNMQILRNFRNRIRHIARGGDIH